MRIARKGEDEVIRALAAKPQAAPPEAARSVEFGREDLLLVLVLAILITGYARSASNADNASQDAPTNSQY